MRGLFKVESTHGTFLAADLATRELVHTAPEHVNDQRPLLFVYIPKNIIGLGFFLFDNPHNISVACRNQIPDGRISAVFINHLAESDGCAFYHLHNRRYLLALPGHDDTGAGVTAFAAADIGEWEKFRLRSDVGEITASLRHQTALINRTLEAKQRGLLALLREASPDDWLLVADILSATLLPTEAEALAERLLTDPDQRRELASFLSADPWASVALPELARFTERRRGLFKVETTHGTVLAADLATRELVHTAPEQVSDRRPLLLVYIPQEITGLGFLIFDNPNNISVACRNRAHGGPISVVLLSQLAEADGCALCHPHNRKFLLALPDLDDTGAGITAFAAPHIGSWENFRLRPDIGEITPSLRDQTALIDRTLEAKRRGILAALREASPDDRPVVGDILSGTLLPAEAEAEAERLLAAPDQRRELAVLLPGDPWATVALPELSQFIERRRTSAVVQPARGANARRIGREFDPISGDNAGLGYVSVAHQCVSMLRRTVAPVKDFCVLAAARNEGLYLLDWIAHHRTIGAERIFIYTNDNTDGSDALLHALADADEITLVQNEVANRPQLKAYAHALSIAPELLDYRWCALIDIDEMLCFDRSRYRSFPEYIAWQELRPVDAIVLNWHIFVSSGTLRFHDAPLAQRFRYRLAGLDPHVKTILRPRQFHHSTCHVPLTNGYTPIICRDATGRPHPISEPHARLSGEAPAWIAHYYFRSLEEFFWKFARGQGDNIVQKVPSALNLTHGAVEAFLKHFNDPHAVADDRMVQFCNETEREVARLNRLSGVARARATIVAHYGERSERLRAALRQIRESASPREAELYDLLLEPSL